MIPTLSTSNFLLIYLAGLDALLGFTSAAPVIPESQAISTSSTKRADAEVIPLKEVGDGSAYTVNMVIDGILLPIHIDTGSSQLWVAHSSCKTCADAQMTSIDAEVSDNCAGQEKIEYAAGSVSGCLVNTSISLGDHTLDNYSVLAATEVSEEIATNGDLYSGTLGLADDSLTNSGGPTLISQLYQQGQLGSPEVGFYLPGKEQNGTEGEMALGNPTSSNHIGTSEPVVLPRAVKEDGVYTVNLDEVKIDADSIAAEQVAVLDTGSIGIGIPSKVSQDIFKQIYGEVRDEDGGKKVACTPGDNNTTSTLTFTFGGKPFGIPYADLVSDPENDGECWALIGAYEGVDDSDEKWVLGDAFLHNLYHTVNVQTGEVKLFAIKE
ncbi:hypothetical protein I302_105319 [Kwoniella bestiolae CBS 10118]|uniref:Peptidase A1 domain-containing protein n=1 Tax=Kwoniella bestiolae CBS 10118 TaxID=1296100 RepID=A0AAJ8K9A5_9TREE